MKKQSAGILLYRKTAKGLEVFIGHPGGPFWAKKDRAAWSIPKGEFTDEEDALVAAKREFREEVGIDPPEGNYADLGSFKQPSGKVVYAYALEADLDTQQVKSNLFEMEWPPKSGQMQQFPEIDKVGWTPIAIACEKVVKGQIPLLEKLAENLQIDIHAQPSDQKTDEAQTTLF